MYKITMMEFEENITIKQYLKNNPNPDIQKQILDDKNEDKFPHISFKSEKPFESSNKPIHNLQSILTMWHESISNQSDIIQIKVLKKRLMNWVNSNPKITIDQLPDETLYYLEIFNRYYEMQI